MSTVVWPPPDVVLGEWLFATTADPAMSSPEDAMTSSILSSLVVDDIPNDVSDSDMSVDEDIVSAGSRNLIYG